MPYANGQELRDVGLLVARLTLGLLVLLHGIAKLRHGIGPIEGMIQGVGLPGFLAYGVYIGEVVGPLLVISGWYMRVGALLIVANMLVAVLLVHRHDIFSLTQQGGWALELQGMYLFIAAALALTGPGRLSFNNR
jgi:putative oxidoreductase